MRNTEFDIVTTFVLKKGEENSYIYWLVNVTKYLLSCCCSVPKFYLTLCNPWTAAHQASQSFTISQSELKFMSIELVMFSNHLILCCPLLFCLQFFPASSSFPMSRLAIPFSSGSSQPRDQTWVSWITGGFFSVWATREFFTVWATTIWIHHNLFKKSPLMDT